MGILNNYQFNFEQETNQFIEKLISSEVFTAIGIELARTKILIEDNNEFALKGLTFGYYDHTSNSIHINIDDNFFKKESKIEMVIAKVMFILLHESHHKILLHSSRRGERDARLFNVAADFEIHNMLVGYSLLCTDSKLGFYLGKIAEMIRSWDSSINENLPPSKVKKFVGCYSSKYSEDLAETIYEKLLKDTNSSQEDGDGEYEFQADDGSQGTATTKTYRDKNGNVVGKAVEVKFKNENKNSSGEEHGADSKNNNSDKLTKELLKQSLTNGIKNAMGKIPGDRCAAFSKYLNKMFEVKIDWSKVLKSSIQTILSKSDYFTWRKPSMASMMLDMYLPSVEDDYEKYGTLFIALDESGSISDSNIQKAFEIVKEAKEYYKQVYIIKHDVEIVERILVDEIDEEAMKKILTRKACGGTSHKEVFEEINKWTNDHRWDDDRISCAMFVTDGYSDIETYQDSIIDRNIPLIYVYSNDDFPRGINAKAKISIA